MPAGLREGMNAFLDHLRHERRLSPHTITGYRRDLESAIAFLEAREVPHWSAVDVHLVRTLVAERHRDGLAGRSLQRLLSALRTLYDYLLREGLASANPAPVRLGMLEDGAGRVSF